MAFKYTEEQLNTLDKALLIQMFLGLQEQVDSLTKETHALNDKMQLMMEQLVLANKNRFGRSSEKMPDTAQISFMEVDGTIVFFNEAEAVCNLEAPEPENLELKPARKKQSGKKARDMSDLPANRVDHYMTTQELTDEFGENGWKQLPDAVAKRYQFVPAKVEVEEHHIGVYASKSDGHMVKAKYPKGLLHGGLCRNRHNPPYVELDVMPRYSLQAHDLPIPSSAELGITRYYFREFKNCIRSLSLLQSGRFVSPATFGASLLIASFFKRLSART
jgi:hypothetical protein